MVIDESVALPLSMRRQDFSDVSITIPCTVHYAAKFR